MGNIQIKKNTWIDDTKQIDILIVKKKYRTQYKITYSYNVL